MRVILALIILLAVGIRGAETFPLKNGDVWVMAGDSITAQHLHSNYFEAFCFARYPGLKFSFRNSGVGGDTIPKVLARFDYDVAAWKPTVVSVELGMNDQGGYSVPQFIENMGKLSERIKAAGARPVFLTSSPINNGDTTKRLGGGNAKLHQYADALKPFAKAQEAPLADQFHAVVDVWGENKPREGLKNLKSSIETALRDEKLPGAEHLKAFLTELAKDPRPLVSMQGDAVHPGAPGQLIMAAALLKELHAEGFVSSASLDAAGKVIEAKGCQVENVKTENGALSFTRLDESIAFPIPDDARDVLPMFPAILELSQYLLKVGGLTAEKYALKINGAEVGIVTAKELADGINLTKFSQGPIAAQGKSVLAAVNMKENAVGTWRGLSRAASAPNAPEDAKEKLTAATKKVEEADIKIRESAKPAKLSFELSPAK